MFSRVGKLGLKVVIHLAARVLPVVVNRRKNRQCLNLLATARGKIGFGRKSGFFGAKLCAFFVNLCIYCSLFCNCGRLN